MSYRTVRVIKHTVDEIPDCGRFEVRVSYFFEYDDNKGRRREVKDLLARHGYRGTMLNGRPVKIEEDHACDECLFLPVDSGS